MNRIESKAATRSSQTRGHISVLAEATNQAVLGGGHEALQLRLVDVLRRLQSQPCYGRPKSVSWESKKQLTNYR